MRKTITAFAITLSLISVPAAAQERETIVKTNSNTTSASFDKLFRRMQAEIIANEAYRIAQAVKRARKIS